MTEIKHPAYELNRGIPTRASVGSTEYEIDENGYLSVADDKADTVMQRLAATYSVEYGDDGEIADTAAAVETAVDEAADDDSGDGDGGDTDEGDNAAEAEAEAQTPAEDGEEGPDETMDRSELEDWNMEALRDRYESLGGDPDGVDMRQKDELIAGILRLQADTESTE